MALEQSNLNLEKLKAKLRERYPNYDFDKKPELDRRCKLVQEGKSCPKKQDRPLIIDSDKNEVCVYLFKQIDENTHYKSNAICYAVVTTEDERKKYEQGKWYEDNR